MWKLERSKELTKKEDVSYKNRRENSVVEEEERGEGRWDGKREEQQNEINQMMPSMYKHITMKSTFMCNYNASIESIKFRF